MSTPSIAQALRDLIATIELHTDCMDGHIDREALDPWIEKAEESLAKLDEGRNMTDSEKTSVLEASLMNIGRLLPPGTEVHYFREGNDDRARMQICYPDGSNPEYAFVGHGPVFMVPKIAAEATPAEQNDKAGCDHDWKWHQIAGEGQICAKCGARNFDCDD